MNIANPAQRASARFFSAPERKALRRAAGHACQSCGASAIDGHADHVLPFSKGGHTTLDNAQWLCPSCNLQKGANAGIAFVPAIVKPAYDPQRFRPWQAEAIAAFHESKKRGFFIAAGVGSGKTFAALGVYLSGDFDLMVVLVPKTGIKTSWYSDGKKLGVNLADLGNASAFDGSVRHGDVHGYVLTNSLSMSAQYDLALLCSQYRVLAVIDEAHHLSDGGAWREAAEACLSGSAATLALSGTPYRSDDNKIIELQYAQIEGSDEVVGVPDYEYGYGRALLDGVVAPVHCRVMGGEVTRHNGNTGGVECFSYDDGDYAALQKNSVSLMNARLRNTAVFSLEWQMASVAEARKELLDMRAAVGHPWGGLIVCYTVEQATALASQIRQQYGDKVMLLVRDRDTASAVSEFSDDRSYDWLVAVEKVTEGVSIDRLKVAIYLSCVSSETRFEQVRGRLARLESGIPQRQQTGLFFIPADPRLMVYATRVRDIINHVVIAAKDAKQKSSSPALVAARSGLAVSCDLDVQSMTAEDFSSYLGSVQSDLEIKDLGRFTLYARHEMSGTYAIDNFIAEDAYQELRQRLRGHIPPLLLGRLSGAGIKILTEMLND